VEYLKSPGKHIHIKKIRIFELYLAFQISIS